MYNEVYNTVAYNEVCSCVQLSKMECTIQSYTTEWKFMSTTAVIRKPGESRNQTGIKEKTSFDMDIQMDRWMDRQTE